MRKISIVSGTAKKFLKVVYHEGPCPCFPAVIPLSRLYLEEAHRKDYVDHSSMPVSLAVETKLLHV